MIAACTVKAMLSYAISVDHIRSHNSLIITDGRVSNSTQVEIAVGPVLACFMRNFSDPRCYPVVHFDCIDLEAANCEQFCL